MSNEHKSIKERLTTDSRLYYIFLLLPVIMTGVIAIVYAIKNGVISAPGLKWNDEAAYYELVKTYLSKGWPRGYWGFDGNHAILGTGSAWSPAILLPYICFGFIFSWSLEGVFYTNIVCMIVANLFFLTAVKPEKTVKLRLIALQATSTVLILYLSTNMSEPYRFSIAISLAGLLYGLFFNIKNRFVKYVLAPVMIVYAVQVYTFFAFCIPIYVFAVMKNQAWWKKLLAAIASMGIVTGASYYFLHLISSNYNIYKTEALLQAMKSADWAEVIHSFVRMLKEGVRGVLSIMEPYWGNALFLWYLPFCAAVAVIALILIILGIRKKTHESVTTTSQTKEEPDRDLTIGVIVLYSIALVFLMYVTLYSIERFTFLRGTAIVILFSAHLLVLCKRKWVAWTLIGIQAIGLIAMPMNLEMFMEDRYLTKEDRKEWDSLELSLFNIMEVRKTGDPWDNTVAVYTLEPKVLASIPAGMGVNMILNADAFPTQAAYLLFSLEEDETKLNSEWLEVFYPKVYEENRELLEEAYVIVYQDEDYIVYQKKGFE